MIALFPRKLPIFSIVALLAVWTLGNFWLRDLTWGIWSVLAVMAKGAGGIAALVMLVGHPKVFPVLTRRLLKGTDYDIGGLYSVDMRSNWPVIERLTRAAVSDSDLFDTHAADTAPKLLSCAGQAVITPGLFKISIKLLMDSTKNDSVSTAVSIGRTENDQTELSYLYRQTNHPDFQPENDEDIHDGAARLCLKRRPEDRGLEWQGTYWTARNYKKGMNTAGRIVLRREKPDVFEFERRSSS